MATFTEKRTSKGEVRHLVQIRRVDLKKPISKTFTLKKDAKAWARDTEAAIDRGEVCQGDELLSEVCRRYTRELYPIQKWGRTKGANIDKLRTSSLGQLSLQELTAPTIIKYATNRDVHPSTVNMEIVVLGTILQTASDYFDLDADLEAFKKASRTLRKLGVIGESDHRDQRCSDEQLKRIIAHLPPSHIPVADLAWFAIFTAMRKTEIVNLRWDDLDLTEGSESILVRQRKHPKKKRDERVPLLPGAVEIIKKQIPASGAGDLIFPYKGGSMTESFRKARDKAKGNVADIRWHDLRHEGCSRLFEMGLDAMTVSLFSGHKNLNMLKRYTHLSAANVLGRIRQMSAN